MFKNSSNEIAALYHKELQRKKELRKRASESISTEIESESEPKPEDFLVKETPAEDSHVSSLDSKIESMADDQEKECPPCPKCNEAHDGACAVKESPAEDMSFLMDKEAKYILNGLGRVAAELKPKSQFAVDLVEATALAIKKEAMAKAEQKLATITELKVLAKQAYQSGDSMSGDLITASIEKIKKS